ncbi:DUF6792 domain-containing protein [Alkalicoccobacillus porphyridii]|uniref:DUF6792 domain-containing protein n=1 Tax=Alkalicoccobacillus porphyridii TaxID=2597270 RepID=A0A554A4D5_9BACI|nr:DUF6792 domain-containing protein [Alkalicoccobacillus porphyridii]TSB48541.1 hypothetical protein FN960_03025 [Alkalicoccobacillus porphyridii]
MNFINNSKPILDNNIRNELTALQYENDDNSFDLHSVINVINSNDEIQFDSNDINVYKTDGQNISDTIGLNSGFDGAAVHITKDKPPVNEIYFFYRGTEPNQTEDILYDAMGIVGGTNIQQIEDAEKFYKEVISNVEDDSNIKLKQHGDGHSLGGHLIATTALVNSNFSSVRGINDAPVNLKQLTTVDEKFRDFLFEYLEVTSMENVKSNDLIEAAQVYYSEESKVITHERIKGEPLYAQTIPNTAYLGHKINYYGDPTTAEFPNLYEAPTSYGIFHRIASPISPALLTVNRFMYDQTMTGLTNTMGRIGENYTVAEANAFITSAYHYGLIMPSDQKVALGVTGGAGAGLVFLTNPLFAVKGYDIGMAWGQMDLHSMNVFIDAYQEADKPVLVQYVDPGSGKRIFVNADTLLQVRDTLKKALEEKEQALQKLKEYSEHTIYEQASLQKSRFRVEMSEKEANWRQFLASEGKTYGEFDLYKPTGISFRREFDEIDSGIYDSISEMIDLYQMEYDQLKKLCSSFESNLHTIFEVDEELAQKISS